MADKSSKAKAQKCCSDVNLYFSAASAIRQKLRLAVPEQILFLPRAIAGELYISLLPVAN
jgi:hypothetical protein